MKIENGKVITDTPADEATKGNAALKKATASMQKALREMNVLKLTTKGAKVFRKTQSLLNELKAIKLSAQDF